LSVDSLEPTEFYKLKYHLPHEQKPKDIVISMQSQDTTVGKKNVVVIADTSIGESTAHGARPDLSGFVFSQNFRQDTTNVKPPISQVAISDNEDADSNYIPRRYKLSFSPDLVYGNAGYSTFYGIDGSAIFAFSDMLGDHQIVFQTNLLIDLRNSDYGLSYYYLPGRIDWGFQAFHSAKFLYLGDPTGIGDTLFRFQTSGVGAMASYPIDRFNRLDFSLMWLSLSRDDLDYGSPSQQKNLVLPLVSYVNDNSLWQGEWFGPNNGSRFNFTFYGTPKISSGGLDIQTFTADYRSYNRLAREFILAYRLSGGISTGRDKQNFFIGGTEGWINPSFHNNSLPLYNVEDFAFLTPVLPLRGFDYAEQVGTHYAVANLEFRFPLLKYLIFGALPIGFANILGTAFVDMGSAWTETNSWSLWQRMNGQTTFQDLLVGTGVGTRLFLFGIPLRIDVAWRFNWSGFSEPIYYFAIGPDF
ncbi:MAG TPA: biopolymer transporter Tol, partial [Bacteroidota bacterium]|nr:biopolymer transporter Tol [Bacteroidota bacterium]